MTLRIIYGRSGSGKTRFCFNEIKEKVKLESEAPLVLLVPEQYTFQAERDLISVLGTGGILYTEVLSFRRLAYRTFNEVGGITYPHIHSAGRAMMIHRIMDQLKDDLKYYTKSANREGFVNTVSVLITEFKRYNISPYDIEKIYHELKEGSSLKEKLGELSLVYDRFEKAIADRYRDADDDLTMAASKLEESCLYDHAEIWIDGFSGFTPQEYSVITKLLTKAKQVNITLCTDHLREASLPTDVFSAVKLAANKLLKIAEENGITVEEPVFLNSNRLPRFQESEELGHLEKNLFSYPYNSFEKETKDILLLSSVNIFAEIEDCARDIIRLCRDGRIRYRDIAVVTGDLNNYERLIEVIFAEYEIPRFLDKKVEITNHPLVRLILAMLDIFNENWSYEAVFRYLKTGLTGIDRKSIDLLENYVLACGIRGSRWTKEEEWHMSPDLIPGENSAVKQKNLLNEINRIRFMITPPLLEFRSKTKGRKKASDFFAALYDFLCMIDVPQRIDGYIEQFKKEGTLDLANEYSQVWNIVMDVFDQTVEVMGEETLTLERFSKVLTIGLAEYQVGLVPASLDQVLVGSVDRSKSHDIKALYILGVNDGVFPSAALEEGILSDKDREVLKSTGLELANDTRTKAFDEQYLVYKALTTPQNYLWISWPIADQDGRSMRPSMIISRLRKLFPKITETSNILKTNNELELLAAKSPAFREMVSAFRNRGDGNEISPLWLDVYKWFSVQEGWTDQCRIVCQAFQYKNIAQPVSTEKIMSLFGSPVYTSVSRLEKYTSCPFGFYLQYGLGAKERKVYRLSPPDIGTFMHAVIERFSFMVDEEGISWRDFDRDWCRQKVSEIVDEMLDKMQGSGLAGSKRFTALALRLKRVVTRSVWLIAEHMRRSSFDPIGYEVGFGDDAELPAITLELDSGQQIKLTGRIDRVDALKTEEGTYLRIVDYKSGSKDFKMADAYYGLQVQLLTYLDAIWENPGLDLEGPVIPGGVLYFKIDDPIVRGKGSEDEIEKAIMKSLKMKGLLLADVKLIKEMDHTIERNSLIIPASLNKGDVLGKNSSVASLEHFYILKKYLRKLLKGLGEEMMKGNVEIRPYKKKNTTSCRFCSFSAVCQFDPSLKENTYKILPERQDREIWELIENDCKEKC